MASLRPLFPLSNQDEITLRNFRHGLRERRFRFYAQVLHLLGLGKAMTHRLRFMHLINANMSVRETYCPQPYSGHAVLFRTESRIEKKLFKPDPILGWGQTLPNLDVVDIPGVHFRHLREPHVSVLADRLNEKIAQACEN
jgi:thioesterase domain-containing protein